MLEHHYHTLIGETAFTYCMAHCSLESHQLVYVFSSMLGMEHYGDGGRFRGLRRAILSHTIVQEPMAPIVALIEWVEQLRSLIAPQALLYTKSLLMDFFHAGADS